MDSDGNKWEVIDVNNPENDVENHDAPMIHHAVLFQKKKLNVLANKEEENVDIETDYLAEWLAKNEHGLLDIMDIWEGDYE